MLRVSAPALAPSRQIDRPDGPATDHLVEPTLKAIAEALWPENAAANLAAEIGCSVRTVERYFEGSRDWSGDAVAVLVAEICRRHAMRNIRIAAKG